MAWHGYLLITDLPPGWTNEQRQQAFGVARGMGKQSGPSPAKINHSRLSLDGTALIIEAEFTDSEIERDAVVSAIAVELSVPEAAVDAVLDYTIFAEGGTWQESRAACVADLIANSTDWEPEI